MTVADLPRSRSEHHVNVVNRQPDRAQAIAQALAQAAAKDVLLIAGKGHEDYQEVAGQRLPFSDLDHVRRALAVWVASAAQQESSP